MRDRIIDFVLLGALIVIAGIIVWTLFGNLFRRDVQPLRTPPPIERDVLNPTDDTLVPVPVEAGDATDAQADIQPVELDGAEDTADVVSSDEIVTEDNSVEPVDLDQAADINGVDGVVADNDLAEATEDASQDAAQEDTEVAAETAPENAAPPEPIPAGAFELERVGFSFVTGGAGACGVILEPWTHVAVSRDILEEYPCGSTFTVNLAETVGGRDSFVATVGDTMNPANSRTVNIYVSEDEPALEYGVREGRLEP